jgi:hypothetical protein
MAGVTSVGSSTNGSGPAPSATIAAVGAPAVSPSSLGNRSARQSTVDYLARHNIPMTIEAIMNRIVATKPADPWYICSVSRTFRPLLYTTGVMLSFNRAYFAREAASLAQPGFTFAPSSPITTSSTSSSSSSSSSSTSVNNNNNNNNSGPPSAVPVPIPPREPKPSSITTIAAATPTATTTPATTQDGKSAISATTTKKDLTPPAAGGHTTTPSISSVAKTNTVLSPRGQPQARVAITAAVRYDHFSSKHVRLCFISHWYR